MTSRKQCGDGDVAADVFMLVYLVTAGFHWVDFSPSVKLKNEYVDSPEPSVTLRSFVNG